MFSYFLKFIDRVQMKLRFSIRDLLWLTLLVALCLAWWIDSRRYHRSTTAEAFATYTDEVLVRYNDQFYVWTVPSARLLPITKASEWDKDSKTATKLDWPSR